MVARLVGEKTLEKYAGKMGADGKWMLIALMMPLPAGDVVCALAGLSEISLGRFAVLNLLGRIPYTALTVLLASGLTTNSGSLQTGGGIVAALLAGTAFFYTWRLRSQQRQSEARLEYTRARMAPEDALILNYVSDESYRQHTKANLNKGEALHCGPTAICQRRRLPRIL